MHTLLLIPRIGTAGGKYLSYSGKLKLVKTMADYCTTKLNLRIPVITSSSYNVQVENLERGPQVLQEIKCTANTEAQKRNLLAVFHNNIQSIRNKVIDLELYLGSISVRPTVIALTEHWLRPFEESINCH